MNLADIAKRNNNDTEIGVIENCINGYSAIKNLDTKSIKGYYFDTFRRTRLPHGSFAKLNEGVDASFSEGEQIRVFCYGYEDRVEISKRAAIASDDSLGDIIADECAAHLEGAFGFLENQIFNGAKTDDETTGEVNNGFIGLGASTIDSMIVDAGGSAASSGDSGLTSVYMLFTGRHGVRFICGKDSALSIGDVREELISDAQGKLMDGYVCPMTGYYGLMVGHTKSVGRIANINSSNPITQKLMGQLLAQFPVNVRPNAIFMNRAAGEMWLDDRSTKGVIKSGATKLNFTGNYEDALVDSFMGIPIYQTDGLLNNEAKVG